MIALNKSLSVFVYGIAQHNTTQSWKKGRSRTLHVFFTPWRGQYNWALILVRASHAKSVMRWKLNTVSLRWIFITAKWDKYVIRKVIAAQIEWIAAIQWCTSLKKTRLNQDTGRGTHVFIVCFKLKPLSHLCDRKWQHAVRGSRAQIGFPLSVIAHLWFWYCNNTHLQFYHPLDFAEGMYHMLVVAVFVCMYVVYVYVSSLSIAYPLENFQAKLCN